MKIKIIKCITRECITYVDDSGIEGFVNFEECYENWVNYKKRVESLNEEQINLLREANKYVGQRDICSNPSYIEFFTRPFLRFEFDEANKSKFQEIQKQILENGWSTLDLS